MADGRLPPQRGLPAAAHAQHAGCASKCAACCEQVLGKLRRKLEQMRELRDLVRSLGRSGGKGPKRMAPQRVSVQPAQGCHDAEACARLKF